MKWQRYHEKEVAWVAAKDMVNAKELVEHFEEKKLEILINQSIGIDEDINFI